MNAKGKYWDEAWNTVIGCTKCSPGCLNCWAEKMAGRLAAMAENHPDCQYAKGIGKYWRVIDCHWWNNKIVCDESILDKPLHWRKPRTVFVNNMGDTFHPVVPFEFVNKMCAVMVLCPQHKFLILTKRPDRMLEYFKIQRPRIYFEALKFMTKPEQKQLFNGFPLPNVVLMTTICSQAEADKNIPLILQTPAAQRGLSIEPMLGPVDLKLFKGHTIKTTRLENGKPCYRNLDTGARLSWVVAGCESGPNRRPCKIEWMIDIVQQCQAAGVKVFVKQVDLDGRVSKNMSDWPLELQVRDDL
ncbi:hypothetical protein LCGC14_1059530 [marine sediment metagenome]|uniref:Phage protein Gp37/Gp68 n=1 Tax=marine sediment metagenome TaxID=412755 RepID=A0A0F9Q4C4_9ZZZZ